MPREEYFPWGTASSTSRTWTHDPPVVGSVMTSDTYPLRFVVAVADFWTGNKGLVIVNEKVLVNRKNCFFIEVNSKSTCLVCTIGCCTKEQ